MGIKSDDNAIRRPGCADDVEPGMLTVAQARRIILQEVSPLRQTETVAPDEALDRVLAADLVAGVDIPGHTNSAVDGYALAAASLPAAGRAALTVVGAALAGAPFAGDCGAGQCVRVTTGAVMPDGADTVVMAEHALLDGGRVVIGADHRAG